MELPFYYDYACPWAYLGSCRAEVYFRDLGVDVDFRPVSLKLIHEPIPDGVERLRMGERKKAHYKADLLRWAEMIGAEITADQPKERPDSTLLLQAAYVAQDEGRFREFHYPAYRARWAEGRDIARPEVVRELLEGAGLDGASSLERAQAPETAERLVRDSEEAIARGVFGVPSLFVGDDMFWGNDRFELVRFALVKRGEA